MDAVDGDEEPLEGVEPERPAGETVEEDDGVGTRPLAARQFVCN